MPVSTSGLTVPQISTNYDSSIYQNQNIPKAMTIADMLDISKKSLDLRKAKETYQPEIDYIKAQTKNAQQTTEQNVLKTIKAHVSNIGQSTSELIKDENLTPEKIIKAYKNVNDSAPGDNDSKAIALQQTLAGMPQQEQNESSDHFQTRLQQFVATNHLKGLEHLSAVQQAYPASTNVSTGGQTVNVSSGNPLTAAQPPLTPTGMYLQNTLPPQVATSPTGGPMQFGGGGIPQAGNLNNRPVGVQVAPAGGNATATGMQQNAPSGQVAPKPKVTAQSMSQPKAASGPIPYMQGETYDAYKNRVAKVQESIAQASSDLKTSNPNSVVNAKYTNEQILKALDDKNIRVGPLMNYMAGKTEGIVLTDDEQYLKKLLETRIQQQQSRSNADQISKSIASGNFGNSKDAIRGVLFKDNGTLTAQELLSKGILNKAGNINKPNLAGVNEFQNGFASDPEVTHLMGVIGSKPLNELTKAEVRHLQKEFAGKSKEEIDALMKKRQALIDSVGK